MTTEPEPTPRRSNDVSHWIATHPKYMLAILAVTAAVMILGGYFAGTSIASNSTNGLRTALNAQHIALQAEQRITSTARTAIYGQCHRQNVRTITGNRNNNAQFKLWQSTITLLTYDAARPSKPLPPQQQALFTAFVASMKNLLNTLAWAPLSNCETATDHPGSYLPPAAIPFVQQLPPLTAFTIGPNE